MIDLKKAGLPESVDLEGSLYYIQTSFKYWLRFLELLENKDIVPNDFDFMYKGSKPSKRQDGVLALMQFCSPPELLPRFQESEEGGKVVDYIIDADYIYAAFLEQYSIDLISSDMHWYKFQALFKGLHDTKLNEIIGYRLYEHTGGKDDDLKDFENKLRGG